MALKRIFKKCFDCVSFVIMTIVFTCAIAQARDREQGLLLEAAVGRPSVTISNPDDSFAGYQGISVFSRVLYPVIEYSNLSMYALGSLRYYDLENTKSNNTQSEIANHSGAGVGGMLRWGGMYVAYEYDYMKAKHYYVGDIGRKFSYDYTASNIEVGMQVTMKQLKVGLAYSYVSATIDKSETDLSKDSNYKEQTWWLKFSYTTDALFSRLGKKLLKE